MAKRPVGKTPAEADRPIRAFRCPVAQGPKPEYLSGRPPAAYNLAISKLCQLSAMGHFPASHLESQYFRVTRDPGVVRPVAALCIGALGVVWVCLGRSWVLDYFSYIAATLCLFWVSLFADLGL